MSPYAKTEKVTMEKLAGGAWSEVLVEKGVVPLPPQMTTGTFFLTTGLEHKDWKFLAPGSEAFRAEMSNGLKFEVRFMEPFEGHTEPPTEMQLDRLPEYSLDRNDLHIRCSDNARHEREISWHEVRLGGEITRSATDGFYGHIYSTHVGQRMSTACEELRQALKLSASAQAQVELAVATFLTQALEIAAEHMTECLARNFSFLWRLSQRFANGEKAAGLGFTKEFYQLSFRFDGLDRRLTALFEAVNLTRRNGVLQACVAADSTGNLSERHRQMALSLKPLRRKIKSLNKSFLDLNDMVINVTGSKKADDANDNAASSRVIAVAALAYSPASIAVGVFGMNLSFITDIQGSGIWEFVIVVVCCYVPVFSWLLYRWTLEKSSK